MTHRFEREWPEIPWRTPVPVTGFASDGLIVRRFACRICIAEKGLKGIDVEKLTSSFEECFIHIFEAHP